MARSIRKRKLCGLSFAVTALIVVAVPANSQSCSGHSHSSSGGEVSPPAPPPNTVLKDDAAVAPELTIISPKDGEIFDDKPIFVKVQVDNFKLEPPKMYFGPPEPGAIGHIHFFFDDYPEVATSSTELMFGKKEGDRYLQPGLHTVAVELVHNNHETLEPRIWKRVTFTIKH